MLNFNMAFMFRKFEKSLSDGLLGYSLFVHNLPQEWYMAMGVGGYFDTFFILIQYFNKRVYISF